MITQDHHCAVIPSGVHNWLPATGSKLPPDGHQWAICGGCGRARTVPIGTFANAMRKLKDVPLKEGMAPVAIVCLVNVADCADAIKSCSFWEFRRKRHLRMRRVYLVHRYLECHDFSCVAFGEVVEMPDCCFA